MCSSCGDDSTVKEESKRATKMTLRLYIPNFFREGRKNGSFGDKLCPNRRSPSVLKPYRWNLPPLASANYVSPGSVNDGGGLRPSELSLYVSIHCSLIGRVLVSWILLGAVVALVRSWSGCRPRRNLGIFYCFV